MKVVEKEIKIHNTRRLNLVNRILVEGGDHEIKKITRFNTFILSFSSLVIQIIS